MNTGAILAEIRKRLQSAELSALVGAGFSKNVHDKLFPSWWQLLREMVIEMHGVQMEEEFVRSKQKKALKQEFINNRCDHFINQSGPLKVAQLYKDFKNYREALEWYIERRTPLVGVDRKLHYYDKGVRKSLSLTAEDLETHTKFVNLPWNNIFTTNYDNLLESCVDADIEAHLKGQKDSLDKKIEQFNADLLTLEDQEADLRYELLAFEDREKKIEAEVLKGIKSGTELQEVQNQVQEKRADVSHKVGEVFWKQREIKVSEEALTNVEHQLRHCSTVISSSAQLALKKNRNIIKLHGSLRSSDEEEFGFDSDAHKHYIITQDDFDTYPQKHEAFTQLMRISLLQEAFCLIGFSGIDPNFLAWIGWVRDILFKSTSTNGKKIYLISMSDKPAESQLVSFYRNHRIVHVPLLSNESIDHMESKLQRKVQDRKAMRQVLSFFFDYLEMPSDGTSPKAAVEVSMRATYESLCQKLEALRLPGKEAEPESQILEKLGNIAKVSHYNRLPSPSFGFDHHRYHFIREYVSISLARLKKKDVGMVLTALHRLIKSQYYPHGILFYDADIPEAFDKLLSAAKQQSKEIYGKFLLIDMTDAMWRRDQIRIARLEKELSKIKDSEVIEEFNYIRALNSAMSLRFGELKRILDTWNPEDYWKINKAGLLGLLDSEEAVNLLSKPVQLLQDNVHRLELKSCIRRRRYFDDNDHQKELKQYEAQKLSSLNDFISDLLKDITKDKKKLEPYGEKLFKVGTSQSFSNINHTLQSFQVFGIFVESGLMASFDDINYISLSRLYDAATKALHHYPSLVLFYCLQYTDAKILRRLAQDFCFSHEIRNDQRSTIMRELTEAYEASETPNRIKSNISVFLSDFINCVDPTEWSQFYSQYWRKAKDEDRLFRNDLIREDFLIGKGLLIIQDTEILGAIISDCLVELAKNKIETWEFAIHHLYSIAQNPVLKVEREAIRKAMTAGFSVLIEKITERNVVIFALGNMSKLLNREELAEIVSEIRKIDYNKVESARLWRILIYFLMEDTEMEVEIEPNLIMIKEAIINSKGLWFTGLSDDNKRLTSRAEFIETSRLINRPPHKGIVWSQQEALQIFDRLKVSFRNIASWLSSRGVDGMFISVLEEMLLFLKDESEHLKSQSDFNDISREVELLYRSERAVSNIMEGLVSDEREKVVYAIGDLANGVYSGEGWVDYDMELNTLFSKVLLQAEPALQDCLGFLASFIHSKKDITETKRLAPLMKEVLYKYKTTLPPDIDEAYVEAALVRMAFVLSEWNQKGENVDFWMEKFKTTNYNNVRYSLKHKLELNETY